MTAPVLGEVDLAMLRLTGEHWRDGSARDAAIRERFGCGPVRFWQRIVVLVASEAALAAQPVLVHRLRRIRDQRRVLLSGGRW